MNLLELVIQFLAAGALVYGIHRAPWISPTFKSFASGTIMIVFALIMLNAFGVIAAIRGVTVPKLK